MAEHSSNNDPMKINPIPSLELTWKLKPGVRIVRNALIALAVFLAAVYITSFLSSILFDRPEPGSEVEIKK